MFSVFLTGSWFFLAAFVANIISFGREIDDQLPRGVPPTIIACQGILLVMHMLYALLRS